MNLRCICNFDPNAWYIPKAFYKFIAKQAADFLFKKIFKLSKTAHLKSWGEKMKSNEEFYSWLRAIVVNYKVYHIGGEKGKEEIGENKREVLKNNLIF